MALATYPSAALRNRVIAFAYSNHFRLFTLMLLASRRAIYTRYLPCDRGRRR